MRFTISRCAVKVSRPSRQTNPAIARGVPSKLIATAMPTIALVVDWKKPRSDDAEPALRGNGASAPAMACGALSAGSSP